MQIEYNMFSPFENEIQKPISSKRRQSLREDNSQSRKTTSSQHPVLVSKIMNINLAIAALVVAFTGLLFAFLVSK